MNGHDYERAIAVYLKRHGFKHVKVTNASSDYGVDIIASKHRHRYAVQCKYYSKPVGVAAVQQVVGGMAYYECDRAMVVTNNVFTRQANELADRNGVVLLPGISGRNNLRLNLLRVVLYLLLADVAVFCPDYRVISVVCLVSVIVIRIFMWHLKRSYLKERDETI